jgi:hypothetical protein
MSIHSKSAAAWQLVFSHANVCKLFLWEQEVLGSMMLL